MTIAYAVLDTLDFVKKLEAAGVEPEIAEAQAGLQVEILQKQAQAYAQVLEKFAEYQPVLDELKVTKHELATKRDIDRIENKIDIVRTELKAEINALRNELIIKLGGIVVASISVLGVIMAFLINRLH